MRESGHGANRPDWDVDFGSTFWLQDARLLATRNLIHVVLKGCV